MATFDASVVKGNVDFGLIWTSGVASARMFFDLLKLFSQTTVQLLLMPFVLVFCKLVVNHVMGLEFL